MRGWDRRGAEISPDKIRFVEMGLRESRRTHPVTPALFLSLIMIAVGAFMITVGLTESLLGAVAVAAIAPALLAVLFRRLRRMNFERVYDSLRSDPVEDSRVSIDALGVRIDRTHARYEIQWELIKEIWENNLGFYLTYGKMQSIYVPRRVFADAAEAQRFWDLAQSYVKSSRSAVVAPI